MVHSEAIFCLLGKIFHYNEGIKVLDEQILEKS